MNFGITPLSCELVRHHPQPQRTEWAFQATVHPTTTVRRTSNGFGAIGIYPPGPGLTLRRLGWPSSPACKPDSDVAAARTRRLRDVLHLVREVPP
jgi:hypothetical protein